MVVLTISNSPAFLSRMAWAMLALRAHCVNGRCSFQSASNAGWRFSHWIFGGRCLAHAPARRQQLEDADQMATNRYYRTSHQDNVSRQMTSRNAGNLRKASASGQDTAAAAGCKDAAITKPWEHHTRQRCVPDNRVLESAEIDGQAMRPSVPPPAPTSRWTLTTGRVCWPTRSCKLGSDSFSHDGASAVKKHPK